MKCFYCNSEVRWNNDFDAEDVNSESEYTIVSMYECDECHTWYEVYQNKKKKNKRKTNII
jgi:hypothetical protein